MNGPHRWTVRLNAAAIAVLVGGIATGLVMDSGDIIIVALALCFGLSLAAAVAL